MIKVLQIDDTTLNWRLTTGNVWTTETIINNLETEIEIDFNFHQEKEVDWQHFCEFFRFINKEDRLVKLVADSKPLISELGKAFFRRGVVDWKMELTGLFYNGKTNSGYSKDYYSYALTFQYLIQKGDYIDGDSYGLYVVEVEGLSIVGARRYQC